MKQTNLIKRVKLLLMMLVIATGISAQTTVKHIVERGETVESIAQKYGVTKEAIIQNNPDAAQFVYVGMEIIVPSINNQVMQIENARDNNANVTSVKDETVKNNNPYAFSSTDVSSKLKIGIVAGYSLSNYVGDDIKDTKNKSGFHIGVDIRYGINNWLFAEGMMGIAMKGYKKETFETSGDGWNDDGPNYDNSSKLTMETTNIEIPLFLGASYKGFFVKAGPYFSYAISGKLKNKYKYIDYPDIHSAEWDEDTEETKIKDMKDFKRFVLGANAGIGYNYDHFLIQFTYQRGFTKLGKESKTFEQNLLFSLGYFF